MAGQASTERQQDGEQGGATVLGGAVSALVAGRSVEGRVVVVTGATAGVGRAVTLRLAQRGATVVAVARTAADLDELAAQSEHITGHVGDIARDEDRAALVDATIDRHGRIDVLVN